VNDLFLHSERQSDLGKMAGRIAADVVGEFPVKPSVRSEPRLNWQETGLYHSARWKPEPHRYGVDVLNKGEDRVLPYKRLALLPVRLVEIEYHFLITQLVGQVIIVLVILYRSNAQYLDTERLEARYFCAVGCLHYVMVIRVNCFSAHCCLTLNGLNGFKRMI